MGEGWGEEGWPSLIWRVSRLCVLWGPMDINAGHSIFGGGRPRRIFILLEWSWLHIPQLLIFVQAGPGRYYSGALIFFLPFIDPHSRWLIDLIGSMDMWKRPRGIIENDSEKSAKHRAGETKWLHVDACPTTQTSLRFTPSKKTSRLLLGPHGRTRRARASPNEKSGHANHSR